MSISVTYRGQVRQAAGCSSETVEVEGPCSIKALATLLAENRGESLRRFLLEEDGSPRRHILYVVGSEHVRPGDPRLLQDGESVTIVPPMAGGWQ